MPHDGCTVEGSRNQIRRVVGPAKIHDIANMPSELSWLPPLNAFESAPKLHRHRLELPNDDQLVIGSTSQEKTVGREPHAVHRFLVASVKIILVLRLDLIGPTNLPRLMRGLELPKSDATVFVGDVR